MVVVVRREGVVVAQVAVVAVVASMVVVAVAAAAAAVVLHAPIPPATHPPTHPRSLTHLLRPEFDNKADLHAWRNHRLLKLL